MPINIDDLTNPDQIRDLITQLSTRLAQLHHETEQETENLRGDIGATVATLDALIGDGTTTPNLTTIVGVQLYSDEQIGQHTVLAIRLLMQGLELTARAARDIAKVVGT